METVPEALRPLAAAHEAGHAVVAWLSPFLRCVMAVTVRNTLVFSTDAAVTPDHLPDFLFQECRMRLAGLAGEMAALGKCRSASAGDDLVRAAEAARRLIGCRGWSEIVGAAMRDCSSMRRLDIGAMFSSRPQLAVSKCLATAHLSARRAVYLNRSGFEAVRLALLTTDALNFRQVARILGVYHAP